MDPSDMLSYTGVLCESVLTLRACEITTLVVNIHVLRQTLYLPNLFMAGVTVISILRVHMYLPVSLQCLIAGEHFSTDVAN